MSKKTDLNKLSFSQLKTEIEKAEQQKESIGVKKKGVWQIGENYVIRTVTMIQVGKLVEVTDEELILEGASWIADTGRWMNFLRDGKLNEVEPFPDSVIVGRKALIDATIWRHNLPRDQK